MAAWARSLAFSASSSPISSRIEPWERNQDGTAVNGRSAVVAPVSIGPNTSPTARRAGSTGESEPPW